MDGLLIIDKPKGPTSHDIVAFVRRLLNIKKVGHTGTLDPMATGVLPLVLGNATKLARYVSSANKTYRAIVRLGTTTKTFDAQGDIVETVPVDVAEIDIVAAVESFVGVIDQMPPMYSAKKVDGKKLYELARQGIDIERATKRVTIFSIDALSYNGLDISMDVHCSSGTYIRVLADDIGKKLGCGAHLISLQRLSTGPFTLEESITLDALVADPTVASKYLQPMQRAVLTLPCFEVSPEMANRVLRYDPLCVEDLRRVINLPNFSHDEALAIAQQGTNRIIAVARTELSSSDMQESRANRRALKTERVFVNHI